MGGKYNAGTEVHTHQKQLHTRRRGHTTYGIALADGSDLIQSVSDLSSDKQRVERLAELCTQLDLSPEHLSDVIEDFLAE